jgi:uncharacterized membrane protein
VAGISYYILSRALIAHHGVDSIIAKAIGRDEKGLRSLFLYTAAIALAFVSPWVSAGLYVVVAIMWFIPDRRIEEKVSHKKE